MFENPKSTPSNPSVPGAKESVEHLVDALSLSANWREHNSLAHTLQQATTLLECFVGLTAPHLWSNEATRVARLVVLVGTMGEHTFDLIQGTP